MNELNIEVNPDNDQENISANKDENNINISQNNSESNSPIDGEMKRKEQDKEVISDQEEYQRVQSAYQEVVASETRGHANLEIKHDTNRLFLKIILVCFTIVTILAVYGAYRIYSLTLPVDKSGHVKAVIVKIPNGSTTARVAHILRKKGLIQSEFVFRQYGKFSGYAPKLKAGEYNISPALSLKEIMELISKGSVVSYTFTIPEGYNLKQITEVLKEAGYVNSQQFLNLALHGGDFNIPLLKNTPVNQVGLEGYLFPETYKVTKDMKEEQIIKMMLNVFVKKIGNDYVQKAAAQGLTLHQAVTLASIVEREASKDSERPKVAAVFLNRLKIGMKLQSDITVQFAIGKPKERIYYKDLLIDSPYNTYKIDGLPPGPIASPSMASLQSVIQPANVDYLYFVVSKNNNYYYSKTLNEHNAAIRTAKIR